MTDPGPHSAADPDSGTPAYPVAPDRRQDLGVSAAENWGLLVFSGADAQSFLQGYFTADVERLNRDQATPTALCNLKGRVVANGWAWLDAQGQVYWLVHRSLTELVITFLSKYLAFAKAEVADVSSDFAIFCVLDTELGAADVPAGSQQIPLLGGLGAVCVSTDVASDWWADLPAQVPQEQVTQRLIEQSAVVVEQNTSEKFLPQMLNLPAQGAVDFDKGCYLGQEVVARAEHRGAVKRTLVRLQGQADHTDAQQNAELTDAAGKTCGEVIMHCKFAGQLLALAVVRSEPTPPLHWGANELALLN